MCKFEVADVVRYVSTDMKYVIMMTPDDDLHLCNGGSKAYLYGDKWSTRKWVRSQEEVEDGRFELVTGD